jgi:transcriptional regulator with XRE-family HTH domain
MAKRTRRSSIGARGIGLELKRLREARRFTCNAVGDALGVSGSTISRIETGKREPSGDEVAAILTVLDVTGVERMRVLEMIGDQDEHGPVDGITATHQTRNYRNFELRATRITNFELALVPGLAQTTDYAQALLDELRVGDTEEDIEEWVGYRMSRQSLLTRRKPPEIHWILTESALRQPIGGAKVLARQLRHLIDLAEQPTITLNVVPASVVTHAGLDGSFVILDFADEPTIVHVEAKTTGLFLDEPETVHRYRLTVARLMDVALDAQASARLLKSVTSELEQGGFDAVA